MKRHAAVACVICALAVLLCGCSDKKSARPDQFSDAAKEAGYTVVTDSESLGENYPVYIALPPDGEFQIEFYDLGTDENADSVYSQLERTVQMNVGDPSAYSEVSAANYASLTALTPTAYYHLSRIGDTVFYGWGSVEDKDQIAEFSESLGY